MSLVPEPAWAPDDPAAAGKGDRQVPWTAKDAIIGILAFLPLAFVIGAVIFAIAAGVSKLISGSEPNYLRIASFGAASFIASVVLVRLLAIGRRGASWAQVGLANVRLWLDIPSAVLGEIIAVIGVAAYSLFLQEVVKVKVPEQPVVKLFGSNETGFIFAIIFVAILAPIGEELFFRGFVYPAFRGRWGVGWGMVGSSAVFALFHVQPLLYVPMFIIGMVLAFLFEYRESLMPCFILHGINNLLALLVAYGIFGA